MEFETQELIDAEEAKLKVIEKEAIISESSDESQKSAREENSIAIAITEEAKTVVEE